MKKNIPLFILLATMPYHLCADETKVIIVDETILRTQKNSLSLVPLLFAGLTTIKQKVVGALKCPSEETYMTFLKNIKLADLPDGKAPSPAPLYKGKQVPPLLARWATNDYEKLSLEAIIKWVHAKKNIDDLKKIIYCNMLTMTFDPTKAAKIYSPNEPVIKLLRECKKKGHILVFASTINRHYSEVVRESPIFKSSYTLFEKNHFFYPGSKIDGPDEQKLIVPGKPQKRLYTLIKSQFPGKSAADFVTLETEPKYVATAKTVGMNGMVVGDGTFLEQFLMKTGILASKEEV